jgi:hypothetical protein
MASEIDNIQQIEKYMKIAENLISNPTQKNLKYCIKTGDSVKCESEQHVNEIISSSTKINSKTDIDNLANGKYYLIKDGAFKVYKKYVKNITKSGWIWYYDEPTVVVEKIYTIFKLA